MMMLAILWMSLWILQSREDGDGELAPQGYSTGEVMRECAGDSADISIEAADIVEGGSEEEGTDGCCRGGAPYL